MRRFGVLLPLLLVAACSGDPIGDAGITCDPMAYQLDDEAWVLTQGDRIRLSTAGMIGVNPSVSPDGEQVVFASGHENDDLDLYVSDVGAGEPRLLYAGDSLQSESDWSPDGTEVVFDEWVDERGMQVFSMDLEEPDPIQLTTGEANAKPKWTPDGDRILFLSLRDGPEQEIYSMARDGSDATNLTNDPAVDVLAEMSPDGSRIAFASDRSGNGAFDIWIMGADGSNPIQLTDAVERDTNPTWSTDGAHIIFRSDRDPAGLWYMNPDGSEQEPLLAEGWLASCP